MATATSAGGTRDFDPLDPGTVRDPHATYARLRERCPVAHSDRWGGFWALTRYDDIVEASTSTRTFSSAEGVVIPVNPASGRRPPLHYDPPEHTAYRRALNPPFREARAAALAPVVRRIAVGLLEPMLARGGGDAVAGLTSPLAVLTLTRFLNLPEGDDQAILKHSERFERAQQDRDRETVEAESRILYDHARRAVEARRAAPLDPEEDVISALLAARVGGRPIGEDLVVGCVRQLIIAGHVAPAAALASAIRHIAGHHHLQELLRHEPRHIPGAIEELLRLYTPNQGFARTTTREVTLRGRTIGAGERVAIVYTSANRDGEVFPDPDAFVLSRSPNRHLAFGHGVHKCPGAPLARVQMRVALEELLTRTSRVSLDGPARYISWPLYGPGALPIRCDPR